jgi:lipopolysaccharide assembly outer membrane protein LptD (OstA)
MSSGINNVQFAQVFVGVKPVPKLDVKASYTIAQADKDGASVNWQSKNYGSEFDLTATYKIYDNLSYMVGFAYLWAGDYFKGTVATQTLDNDYLVTHKLTLTF